LGYLYSLNETYNVIKGEINALIPQNKKQMIDYLNYILSICKACKNTYFNMYRDIDLQTRSIEGFLYNYLESQEIFIKTWKTDLAVNNANAQIDDDIKKTHIDLNKLFFAVQNRSIGVFNILAACTQKYLECINNFNIYNYDITNSESAIQNIVTEYLANIRSTTITDRTLDTIANNALANDPEIAEKLGEAQIYLIKQYQDIIKELYALRNIFELSKAQINSVAALASTSTIAKIEVPTVLNVDQWKLIRAPQLENCIKYIITHMQDEEIKSNTLQYMQNEETNINNIENVDEPYKTTYITPYLSYFYYPNESTTTTTTTTKVTINNYYNSHAGKPLNTVGKSSKVTFIDIKIPDCICDFALKALDTYVDNTDGYFSMDIPSINDIIKSALNPTPEDDILDQYEADFLHDPNLEDEEEVEEAEEAEEGIIIVDTTQLVQFRRPKNMLALVSKLFAFLKNPDFGRLRNSDKNRIELRILVGIITKILLKKGFQIDEYMNFLGKFKLKCGNFTPETIINPNHQDLIVVAEAEQFVPSAFVALDVSMATRMFSFITTLKNEMKTRVHAFITNIQSWYTLSPLPLQAGGGCGPNCSFSFDEPGHMKEWDEALTLATFMDKDDTYNVVEVVNTFVEIMDDVAKSQYFDDNEKDVIVIAINNAVEQNDMNFLEAAIHDIKQGWWKEPSPSQKYQHVQQSQTYVDEMQLIKHEKEYEKEYKKELEENPSQNTNGSSRSTFAQAPSSGIQTAPNISGNKRTNRPSDDGSVDGPGWGGAPKTFKSSFFKDSAMPHWHSSASPFNQYATMKRLYRKNFKRFLLKYKMQGEQVN
jgi:hypothetical protein